MTEQTLTKLEPCPFCGEEPAMCQLERGGWEINHRCGNLTVSVVSLMKKHVITSWNRRASPARDGALKEALRAGAVAYADLLREVPNKIPSDLGTDRQAYDHIIRRLQDKFGNYESQITLAVGRALSRPLAQRTEGV